MTTPPSAPRTRRRTLRAAAFALWAGAALVTAGGTGLAAGPPLIVCTLAEPGSDRFRVLEAMLARFKEAHPGAEAELTGPRLKLDYQMRSIIAHRSADLIEARAGEVAFFARRGALTDLTADCMSIYTECSPRAWRWAMLGKRFYAVPWAALPMLLLYDKAAFRRAGLDPARPPRTWAELLQTARTLARDTDGDNKPDVFGFAFAGGKSVDLGRHAATFFAELGQPLLVLEDEVWSFRLDTDEGRRVARFLLALRDVSPPECVVTDDAGALEQFRSGRAAMVLATPAGLARPDDAGPQEIGVAPVPAPAEGVTRTGVAFCYFCVPAYLSDERKANAVKLAVFLASDRAQQALARGAGGVAPVVSIRQDLLDGSFYKGHPELRLFAESLKRAAPIFPSLIWEGKCSKDWIGSIHAILVDDRRTVDEAVAAAQEKGNQALSCLYTNIGHPTLTMKLGMITVALLVFVAIAYAIARH